MPYNLILAANDVLKPLNENLDFPEGLLKNRISERGGKIDGDHIEYDSKLGTITIDIERNRKSGKANLAFILLPLSLNESTAMIALAGLCLDIASSSNLRLFDPQKGMEITKKNLIYWGSTPIFFDKEIRLPSKNLIRIFAIVLTIFLLLLILIWSVITKK